MKNYFLKLQSTIFVVLKSKTMSIAIFKWRMNGLAKSATGAASVLSKLASVMPGGIKNPKRFKHLYKRAK